jgi:hypothetical protein
MAAATQQQPMFVPTVEAVRWGLDALRRRRIHPFFLAYLHLRKRSQEEGDTAGIHPEWEELGEHLRVSGGPPGKPFYRPVWNGKPDDVGRYWLNPNLAGSYAPSSLRNVPYKVISTSGSTFSLKPNHASLALEHLLYEEPLSAVAFAAFYYRDFGLITSGELPTPMDLAGVFARDFHFDPRDQDFDTLFATDIPSTASFDRWFEPLDADTLGVE